MTVNAPAERRPWALLFVAVCLVAVNLRMTITGVGPLLEQIAAEQRVSPATLGALASVPLLAWGLFSPLAQGISARLGLSRAVSGSLVVLALGTVWRSLPGPSANLWLGTALIGFGLAIGNVLMPAVIKRDFGGRVPLVMGAYTALLGGVGAVAAGIVVPISQLPWGASGESLGWRVALLATGLLLPPALVVWVWANRGRSARGGDAEADQARAGSPDPGRTPPDDARAGRRIWGDPLAWQVSIYMGAQSASFYMLSTWLAPYAIALGRSPVLAGVDVMTYQLIGIAGSMLLPLIARGRLRRWAPALVAVCSLVAAIGFVAAPALLPLWLVVGGLAAGSSLTLALTLTAVRARSQQSAAALSGMAQSVGYLVAAGGPIAFGWLHGLSGGWVAPFALVWLAVAVQLGTGLAVGRPRFVLSRG